MSLVETEMGQGLMIQWAVYALDQGTRDDYEAIFGNEGRYLFERMQTEHGPSKIDLIMELNLSQLERLAKHCKERVGSDDV